MTSSIGVGAVRRYAGQVPGLLIGRSAPTRRTPESDVSQCAT